MLFHANYSVPNFQKFLECLLYPLCSNHTLPEPIDVLFSPRTLENQAKQHNRYWLMVPKALHTLLYESFYLQFREALFHQDFCHSNQICSPSSRAEGQQLEQEGNGLPYPSLTRLIKTLENLLHQHLLCLAVEQLNLCSHAKIKQRDPFFHVFAFTGFD